MIDLGAGDGGYVLQRARTEPRTFAIAVDASPDALTAGAWRARRHRLSNAAFWVVGIERLPTGLCGLADEVTVHFPWGSLLRGLVTADPAVLAPIASVLKRGGTLQVLVSATARDGLMELTPARIVATGSLFLDHGLQLNACRWATSADLQASHSAWAKRLGVGRTRQAIVARYRRDAT